MVHPRLDTAGAAGELDGALLRSELAVLRYEGSADSDFPRQLHLLNSKISQITGISKDVVQDPLKVQEQSITCKLSWVGSRSTSKLKDST